MQYHLMDLVHGGFVLSGNAVVFLVLTLFDRVSPKNLKVIFNIR